MCGIFGCSFYKNPVEDLADLLIKGIDSLAYRGYDSSGIGLLDSEGSEKILKSLGKVEALKQKYLSKTIEKFKYNVGIAHTRWATHGSPSEINTHPHTSSENNEFMVTHNGIISNSETLRSEIEKKGINFESETDTECIPKLFLIYYKEILNLKKSKPCFKEVAKKALERLEGSFSIQVISKYYPGQMILAKNESPLIIGIAADESSFTIERKKKFKLESINDSPITFYSSSDITSFFKYTNKAIFLGDDDIAHIIDNKLEIEGKSPIEEIKIEEIKLCPDSIKKNNYPHYLIKEINEQPKAIQRAFLPRIFNLRTDSPYVKIEDLEKYKERIYKSKRLIFVACGTSYNSAIATRVFIEEITKIPVSVELASDFSDRSPVIYNDDLFIFISQSGETADTINCLKYCKEKGTFTVGITNVLGSQISRISDVTIPLYAEPEISVASTKAYTCQIILNILLGIYISYSRKETEDLKNERFKLINEIIRTPAVVEAILKESDQFKKIAEEMKDINQLLLISRGFQYATSLEASLKIKELCYIHAEAILAGELKHGPLALVDENLSVFLIMPKDRLYEKTYNSLQQIKARGGKISIFYCSKDGENPNFECERLIIIPNIIEPLQVIPFIIPFQLISYHIAVLKGYDVDFPRNLAKSVTVE